MSIAEKLKAIAENEAKVCNAGFVAGYGTGFEEGEAIGLSDGYTFGYEEGHAKGYEEGYNTGSEEGIFDGKQEAYDLFWDTYQEKGKSQNYLYGFAGTGWNDSTYNPKYPLKPYWNASFMYAYSNVTDTKVDIDFSIIVANAGTSFQNATKLKTIRKLIVGNDRAEIGWINMFNNCPELENLVIEGTITGSNSYLDIHWSTKLSRDSIISILNALSPNARGRSAIFSATAVNNAFEGGSAGSEWLNLIATKPNWTISLV